MEKDKKKKVLILNHGLHISGVSRTLVNFANALVNHGYDVTIKIEINNFTLQSELDPRVKCSLFLEEPHVFGVRVKGFLRFYNKSLPKILKYPAKKQYELIVKDDYDIELAFNRGAAAKIISGSTNSKSKKLVWVHSDYMRNDNPLAGFESLEDAQNGYAQFDKIVCVSEQAEKAFSEKFGEGYPLVTRYNIMDVDRIREMSQAEVVTKNEFTIVSVGRLCEAKNYFMLMDAVSILNQRRRKLQCCIVGDGNLKEELINYKESLNLNNVTFTGAKQNPYPYMKAADLYVSSSIYEGLSTTTIEALILGLPCVVTDCTGMKNILGENGEYGKIVPINAEALADAIEKMMVDSDFRIKYQTKAKERAMYFDPEKAFKNIEELFK